VSFSYTYAARSYAGGASPTTLTAGITGTTDGTGGSNPAISLGTLTNWTELNSPTNSVIGTSGGYVIAISAGTATEEKIYVPQGVTGTSLNNTGLIRGYDGTTAQSHATGSTVSLVWSATEAGESNKAVQAVQYLYNGGTDSNYPGAIVVGSSSTGSNGSATTVAKADHWHAIPAASITAAVTPTYVQSVQSNPNAWVNSQSNNSGKAVTSNYPTGFYDSTVCASVGVSGYHNYLVTITFYLTATATANPYIGFSTAGTTFISSTEVWNVNSSGGTCTASWIFTPGDTGSHTIFALVTRNTGSSTTHTAYGSNISVIGVN
jgi:hypothetical protein